MNRIFFDLPRRFDYRESTAFHYSFFLYLLESGVDDKDLLPYFPYRDDGEKILEVIENLVKGYVDL